VIATWSPFSSASMRMISWRTRPAAYQNAENLLAAVADLAGEHAVPHDLLVGEALQGIGGEPVLLLDQDRARWDRLLIRRGLKALERAERLGGEAPAQIPRFAGRSAGRSVRWSG
jgi:hypothetical protein